MWGHDRDPEFFSAGSAALLKDVLLPQREERFHRCVVTGRADFAHRADHLVAAKCPVKFSAVRSSAMTYDPQRASRNP
jgi:hypothetical protein